MAMSTRTGRVRVVEALLDGLSLVGTHAAVEQLDGLAVILEVLLETRLQIVEGGLVFGEDDQAFVVAPIARRREDGSQ